MKIFDKKIVMVGPGILPIPVSGTNGWGGIENTITRIIYEFDRRNQNYVLVNDQHSYVDIVKNETANKNAVVHVHYDDYAPSLKNLNCPLIATSHSPFHPHFQTWTGGVLNHFQTLFNSIDSYFGQSKISNDHALKLNNIKTGLCRVGIPNEMYAPYRKSKGNKRSLVIGKIEPRKAQADLQQHFSNLNIDFVGPIADERFKPHSVGNTNYLGVWSRSDVQHKMTEYSSLILLSHFEGDVGVVKEALASGCSLIITPAAALNIDQYLPFVRLIQSLDPHEFAETVHQINQQNELYRPLIVDYFIKKFDIKVTTDEYIDDLNRLYA